MGSGKSEKIGIVFHIYVKAVYDQYGHCMAEWKGVNGRYPVQLGNRNKLAFMFILNCKKKIPIFLGDKIEYYSKDLQTNHVCRDGLFFSKYWRNV